MRNVADEVRAQSFRTLADPRFTKIWGSAASFLYPESPDGCADKWKRQREFASLLGFWVRSPIVDLYSIRRDISSVVQSASDAMRTNGIDVTMGRDLLPSQSGFLGIDGGLRVGSIMLEDGRVVPNTVDGIGWFSTEDGNLLVCVAFCGVEANGTHATIPSMQFTVAFGDAVGPSGIKWKHSDPSDDDSREQRMMSYVLSLFLFLKQSILVATRTGPDRSVRRQAQRRGEMVRDFMDIILRKSRHHGQVSGGDVEWSCRWIVRGHWRNQWIPSTKSHRPVFVHPYEKGPEDKPLKPLDQRHFQIVR